MLVNWNDDNKQYYGYYRGVVERNSARVHFNASGLVHEVRKRREREGESERTVQIKTKDMKREKTVESPEKNSRKRRK